MRLVDGSLFWIKVLLTLSKDPAWLNQRAMENGAVRSKSPELPKSTCVSPLNSPAVK